MRVAVLLLAVGLIAGACSPLTTKYPIGSTTGLQPDADLIGTWVARDPKTGDVQRNYEGKTAVFYHLLPGKNETLQIVVVGFPEKPDDHGETLIASATSGRAGDNHYLNVTWPPEERKADDGGSIPYRYAHAPNGDLMVYEIDDDKVVAAIQSGAIAGTVEEKNSYGVKYKVVRITADPLALDAFFATPQGAELFTLKGFLKRLD